MNYGRYQIVKEVGRGSMGVVYQALDPRIERLVALKVLRQDRLTSDEIVRRFLKEAKAIGRLTHPHIVTVYDIGEEKGTVYIAMEFIEGVSLAEFSQGKRLDTGNIISIGIQLAETLDFAHQRGVIHRDIKPSNIIVQKDGKIKITDFGIARIEDPSGTAQTQVGDIIGTPAYMSPEQVSGQTVDGRSDIFSLGIILYELSTGQRPFGDGSMGFLLVFNEILKTTPKEPLAVNPFISKRFSGVIVKALEKEPGKRFQTGNDFAEALKGCLNEKVQKTVEGSSVRKHKLNYAVSLGVVLLVLTLIGGSFYFSSRHRENVDIVTGGKDSKSSEEKNVDSSLTTQSKRTEPEDKDLKAPHDRQDTTSSSIMAEKPGVPKVEAIFPKDDKPKNTDSSTQVITERANVKQSKVADQRKPIQERKIQQPPGLREPLVTPKDLTPESNEPPMANVPLKPAQKFAFLKVGTTPSGAQVYINGILKGTTPIILKLDLGQYQVRLSRSGHQEVERQIKLDKMAEYPLLESLKPLD